MPKISARKLILCELLHLNFKRKNNVRGKGYRCGKFLWKDTRKESFMFWLRNGNYLITSSSSSTLLLDILIFRSDASQSLFCLIISCCIQQFHWLIILSNNLFHFRVIIFATPKRKKKFSTRKRNVFSRSVCAKLKMLLSAEKFLKWIPAFIFRKEKPSIRTNKFTSRRP